MKKLIFAIAIIGVFGACKKSDTPLPTKDGDKSEVSTTSEKPGTEAPTADIVLREYKEQQVADILKTKNNDTLYVTNFFATWCGPCMIEIPHFKEEMEALKGKKVKFTFVSVDNKEDWNTKVKEFGNIQGLSSNIVLFDMMQADPEFAKKNTKTWTGESIPFTRISKGDKVDETIGSLSQEQMQAKIKAFN